MLPIYFKDLGSGTFPTPVKGTLYTVPLGKVAMMRNMKVTNASGALRTVNVYINRSGISRPIVPFNLQFKQDYHFEIDESVTLEAGDMIEADSDGANVHYVITGGEETP